MIIVVDDEEPLRLMLCSLLRMSGFRVLLAGTSNEALRICRQFRRHIDLMMTDVEMPGLSGFVLAEEVTRSRPAMRVVFMSCGFSPQDCDVRERLRAGHGFLEKPFSRSVLVSKLERMIAAA